MNLLRRWLSTTAIRFQNGRCTLLKGKAPSHQLSAIADLLRDAQIPQAELWLNSTRRTTFSPNIPTHLHQPLRNILST